MKKILFFLCLILFPPLIHARIVKILGHPERQITQFYDRRDVVMVTSPGRAGSSLLFDCLNKYAYSYDVLKSHMLPPSRKFKGKILFIFSNPDEAAESALHKTILSSSWGASHFRNVLSSNKNWLEIIKKTSKQTIKYNLLSHDALGCTIQLHEWLEGTIPSKEEDAQILAIKYENLWDPSTISAIKHFLRLKNFTLPPKHSRGYIVEDLHEKELVFREVYNQGTPESPKYAAYNVARSIWEKAPPFQYFKLK